MAYSVSSFQHYLLGIVAVANNIPAIAPFLALVAGLKPPEVRRLTTIASIGSFVVMVISLVAGSTVLEFEFYNDVGSGLGPTREFYTLVAKAFREDKADAGHLRRLGLAFVQDETFSIKARTEAPEPARATV